MKESTKKVLKLCLSILSQVVFKLITLRESASVKVLNRFQALALLWPFGSKRMLFLFSCGFFLKF